MLFIPIPTDPSKRLFQGEPGTDGRGCVYFLHANESTLSELRLKDALLDQPGILVFTLAPLHTETESQTQELLKKIASMLNQWGQQTKSGILWILEVGDIRSDNAHFLLFQETGPSRQAAFDLPLGSEHLRLTSNSLNVSLNEENIINFEAKTPDSISLQGTNGPSGPISFLRVPVSGPNQGCILIEEMWIDRRSLLERLRVGFQLVYSHDEKDQQLWYPFIEQNRNALDLIGFSACLDVFQLVDAKRGKGIAGSSVKSSRTRLNFTGRNSDGKQTELDSYYLTRLGYPILLIPLAQGTEVEHRASLVMHSIPHESNDEVWSLFSPAGDFILSEPLGAQMDQRELICGLSGTEYITFASRDRLRFTPDQPAYSSVNPFGSIAKKSLSITTGRNVLTERYRTSWAQIITSEPAESGVVHSIKYLAQPIGSTLYGNTNSESGQIPHFGFLDTSSTIGSQENYPLLPYGGISQSAGKSDQDPYVLLERQVVSPVRRHIINTHVQTNPEADTQPTFVECSHNDYQATTPSGLLVSLSKDSRYLKVLLGTPDKDEGEAGPADLSFVNVSEPLQKALQSNQLFLVATNSKFLGASGSPSVQGPMFCNQLNIGEWKFHINVSDNEKNPLNYSNILIIKGRNGQSIQELVSRPETWTQPNDFILSTFSDEEEVKASESGDMMMLSRWMQQYIEEALQRSDGEASYIQFRRAVTDPNWKGVLILKASITFPASLEGLKPGMIMEELYAHHIGCEMTPIGKELKPSDQSAMFGLISYKDPHYEVIDPPKSVDIAQGDYDFRVLLLRAVITGGKISDFYCLTQLTMKRWFGQTVSGLGKRGVGPYAVLLEGSIQRKDGKIVYVMDTKTDSTFVLEGHPIERIQLTKATLQTETTDNCLLNHFFLDGYISFRSDLEGEGEANQFDLFSFGKENEVADRQHAGLRFSSIRVDMSIPRQNGSLQLDKLQFTFNPVHAVFDLTMSRVREKSLYNNFSMELIGLEDGKLSNKQIADLGFTKLSTRLSSTWVDESINWYALRFRIRIGTTGALAGHIPMQTELMLAWMPTETNRPVIYAGLKLGKEMLPISLQGIMKLDIDKAVLDFDPKTKGFYIQFHQMFLSFLGMKLPGNGAASVYLFGSGNPAHPLGWYAIYSN